MKIKNIDKASLRIRQAVEKGEQIVIFGDSDLDGIASMVIVKESIDNLVSILSAKEKKSFPKILVLSPDRKNEGYGLNVTALQFIKNKTKKGLLILLDCGITNFDEIDEAKNSGFSVIVIDHHKVIDKIPDADIVVDPKQPDDDYPFKDYANVGLAFRLSQELLKEKMSPMLERSFLELVALATISDMMPEVGENSEMIEEGLKNIQTSDRPAIRSLFNLLNPMDFNSLRDMILKVNSALNSSAISEHVPKPYLFLTESDFNKAEETAEELLQESRNKQRQTASLVEILEKTVLGKPVSNIIFEGSPNWESEYLGATASRLVNIFDKPVFLYRKGKDVSRGTVRLPKDLDAVKAMESCKELLVMFGGHAPAAGFTIKNENLDEFRDCLNKYFD